MIKLLSNLLQDMTQLQEIPLQKELPKGRLSVKQLIVEVLKEMNVSHKRLRWYWRLEEQPKDHKTPCLHLGPYPFREGVNVLPQFWWKENGNAHLWSRAKPPSHLPEGGKKKKKPTVSISSLVGFRSLKQVERRTVLAGAVVGESNRGHYWGGTYHRVDAIILVWMITPWDMYHMSQASSSTESST